MACPSLEVRHLLLPHNPQLLQGGLHNSSESWDGFEMRIFVMSSTALFSSFLTIIRPPVGATDRYLCLNIFVSIQI